MLCSKQKRKCFPAVHAKLRYMQRHCRNHMLRYVVPQDVQMSPAVSEVIRSYDVIGVVERFEESLVVLADRLKIPLSHVLHLPSKNSSRELSYGTDSGVTPHVPLSKEPPMIVQHIESQEWLIQNSFDIDLVQQANAKLDEQISRISDFPARLKLFRLLQQKAIEKCLLPATVPVSERDCLWNDNGCGFTCLGSLTAF